MPAAVGEHPVVSALALGQATSVFAVRAPTGGMLAAKVAHTRVAAEQLTREHRVLRRIEGHPGILRSHGLTRSSDGAPAMLMDLALGQAAQSRVKAIARPGYLARTREAARIAWAVGEALQHVHGRGLVHRDVKGTNVCVREDGHTWLLDFGIAAELSGEGTDYGVFMGTVPCAAPEQVAGGILGEETDTFALGSLLYRMLLARRPYEGESPSTLMEAHRAGPPPPPHALMPTIPRPLSLLTMAMIGLDPTTRPALQDVCAHLASQVRALDLAIARDPYGGRGVPGSLPPDPGSRDRDSG